MSTRRMLCSILLHAIIFYCAANQCSNEEDGGCSSDPIHQKTRGTTDIVFKPRQIHLLQTIGHEEFVRASGYESNRDGRSVTSPQCQYLSRKLTPNQDVHSATKLLGAGAERIERVEPRTLRCNFGDTRTGPFNCRGVARHRDIVRRLHHHITENNWRSAQCARRQLHSFLRYCNAPG